MAAARVLLVEDEALIRLVTAEMLRDEGFEVFEARDGDEARTLLNDPDNFDVLFTDVRMPGTLDGIDLALHVRSQHPSLPVLVVSGYVANIMRRLSGLQPAAVFIRKPYSLVEVANVLRRLTGIM